MALRVTVTVEVIVREGNPKKLSDGSLMLGPKGIWLSNRQRASCR